MIKILTSIIFVTYCCTGAASQSLSGDEEGRNASSKSPHTQLKSLVLNQRQFDDNLNACDSSTELVISGPFISKLPLLLRHTELAGLDLSLSSGLDDESLQKICRSLPNLILLNLTGMEVTNESLKGIKNLSRLQVLNIKDTFISELDEIPSHVQIITK